MAVVDERSIPDTLVATPGTLSSAPTNNDKVLEALALVDGLKEDFQVRDQLFHEVEKAVFLANDVYVPKKYKKTAVETRSPLPVHSTNTITAALSINRPSVHFDAEPIGDTGQANKELRQQFFEAGWHLQEQEARRRLFRMFVYSVVVYGEGIMKTVERTRRAWSGYHAYAKKLEDDLKRDDKLDDDHRRRIYDAKTEDYKRGCAYPIASTDVLPQTFYYVQGEDGFTTCVEDKLVPYYDTLDTHGLSLNDKGQVVEGELGLPTHAWHEVMGKSKTLRCLEIWRHDRCFYILQGPGDIPRKRSKDIGTGYLFKEITNHGYGDPERKCLIGPYFHSYGTTTNSREPGKTGLSVLFGYLDLFRLMDSLLTIQSHAAHMFGFPTWRRTGQVGAGVPADPFGRSAGQLASQDKPIEPGDIMPFDVAPLEPPRGSEALDKSIVMVRQMLESLLPSVVQGVVSGDMAGYAINQAAHLARLSWDPILDNIEFALAERTNFESMLIEKHIGERVYVPALEPSSRRARSPRAAVGHIGVGPQDLNGVHMYRVQLDPEMPSDQVIETRTWREKLDLGIADLDDAVEALGGNPREQEKKRLIRKIKDSDVVQELLTSRILKRIATIDQQKMSESGAPPPGAAPQTMPGGDMTINMPPPMAPNPGGGAGPQPMPNPRGQPGAPGAVQGGVPGTPVTPSLPAGAQPLPGQG